MKESDRRRIERRLTKAAKDETVIDTADTGAVSKKAAQVATQRSDKTQSLSTSPKTTFADYMKEYLAAEEELERQRQVLIKRRGGEDKLTEADHTTLENLRDILSLWQEKYLVQ